MVKTFYNPRKVMERYTFLTKTQAFEFVESIRRGSRPHSPYPDYISLIESETYTLYIYSGGYRPGSTPLGYFQDGQFIPSNTSILVSYTCEI